MPSANGYVLTDQWGNEYRSTWPAAYYALIGADEDGPGLLIHCETWETAERVRGAFVFDADFQEIDAPTWRGLNGPDGIAVMPGEQHYP